MSNRARSPVAFGHYVITRRIARGGMAEIYRARTRGGQDTDSHWVAVKMMRPSLGHEDLRARLFSREAKIASMLHHENVVPLYEYGTEMGRPYLAMEYVRGRDLSHLVKSEKKERELIPFELGVYIGQQAAAGLGHAHGATGDGGPLGIVHRDVSPGNVMVGYDGSVKVLDFGVARMNEMQGFHTQTGTLRGKFAYMSPEQTVGEELDARSDVFSLGTVLYELLTGSNCFRAANPISTLEQVQGLRPVPPSRANREIPKAVDKILARCLAKDRRRRFQDGRALCDALGEFLDSRNFGGREVLAEHMSRVFSWEKHEEESELQREEEEVALLEVVDFALLRDQSALDAKNVQVSLQEEASQSEVKNVSLRRTDDESVGVFEGDPERPPSIIEEPHGDILGDAPHQSGERVEMSSLLVAPGAGGAITDDEDEPLTQAGLRPLSIARGTPVAPPPTAASLPRFPSIAGDLRAAVPALGSPDSGASSSPFGPAALPRVPSDPGADVEEDPEGATLAFERGEAATIPPGTATGTHSHVTVAPFQRPRTRSAPVFVLLLIAVAGVAGAVAWGMSGNGDEGRAEKSSPTTIEPVRITLEDEDEEDEKVAPKNGAARRTALAKNGNGARRRVSDDAVDDEAKVAARAKRRAFQRKARRPNRRKATGFLNVGAKPWGEIRIDGEAWPYQTPQANIRLSVGKHRVTLFCPDTGVSASTVVYIKSGKYRTVMMDLRGK